MTAFDYILDGLEAALELERELGVRTVEIDRELLKPPAVVGLGASGVASASGVSGVSSTSGVPGVSGASSASRASSAASASVAAGSDSPRPHRADVPRCRVAFVHDRPLSEKGVEMMAKILTAMGRTAENTPIVVAPPLPKAKIVVVLGGLALKKYFPEMRGEPGQWQKTPEGLDVLITYSPEYILRFATVTPAVQKIKQDMWRSLKAVVQRLG